MELGISIAMPYSGIIMCNGSSSGDGRVSATALVPPCWCQVAPLSGGFMSEASLKKYKKSNGHHAEAGGDGVGSFWLPWGAWHCWVDLGGWFKNLKTIKQSSSGSWWWWSWEFLVAMRCSGIIMCAGRGINTKWHCHWQVCVACQKITRNNNQIDNVWKLVVVGI